MSYEHPHIENRQGLLVMEFGHHFLWE